MFKEDEAKCASCLINGTIFSFCILQTDNITKPQDIQGLSLLVDAEEAKDVKNKDLVIDPVLPAGSLV